MSRQRADDDAVGEYSSPPCFMHEVDPAYSGLALDADTAADAQQWTDVKRWRKAERRCQIDRRLAMDPSERARLGEQIAAHLDNAVGDVQGLVVSAYWPFRGEPDLRSWMKRVSSRGGTCALPVVVERGAPLVFRAWQAGARLVRGIWDIPVPADGAEVVPDVVVAPVVAFDAACFRLGYGGGFFDRTLAIVPGRPRIIGVGYSRSEIPTIYPQPHDIPMDMIVTEAGLTCRNAGSAAGAGAVCESAPR